MSSMKKLLIALVASNVLCPLALAQLEYIADWAPDPLPQIDLDAFPKTYYINEFDETPVYPEDYSHHAYIDPNAPNGGTYRVAATGTFDSFNSVVNRGQLASGFTSLAFTPLINSNYDDIDTAYVVGAEYLQMPEDRSWVLFKIRDSMTWPNGDKITPQDYIWTFQQQLEHAGTSATYYTPRWMAIQDMGDNRVLIRFNPDNLAKTNPIQAGILRILPRYHFDEEGQNRTLAETFLEPFPTNGAYEVTDFQPGQYIEWSRKKDWWGYDVPALKGSYQDKIIYTYYGDRTAQREAMKVGDIDLFAENSAKSWALDWNNVDAIEAGDLRKETRPAVGLISPQAFVLNHRRAPFDNRLVRKALNSTFDFETTNRVAFFDQYSRTNSYFQNSDLQAKGMPTQAELAELQALQNKYGDDYVPDEVFGEALVQPTSDGSGNARNMLRQALSTFAEAGWTLNDQGQLVDDAGQQMRFEIVYRTANSSRFIDPWVENLRRIGIDADARLLEPNVWWDSLRNHDFDVTSSTWQMNYSASLAYPTFGSEFADTPQSRNFAGVTNPAIDDITNRINFAKSREELNVLARVTDRLLQHNHIGVLQWYVEHSRLLWWNKFNEGIYQPQYGGGTTGWYIDQEMEAALIGRSGYSLN